MKKIKKSPDAATGSTTADKFLLPNEMFAIAYDNFADIYNEAKAYSKYLGLNMFEEKSSYSFATDMALYYDEKDVDRYINRMLKQYCKNNKQAYYEMIMSVLCMLEIYHYLQQEDEIKFFRNWQYKLQYDENFYKPYITEEEMSDYWRLH